MSIDMYSASTITMRSKKLLTGRSGRVIAVVVVSFTRFIAVAALDCGSRDSIRTTDTRADVIVRMLVVVSPVAAVVVGGVAPVEVVEILRATYWSKLVNCR
jgi:hypothetical protein